MLEIRWHSRAGQGAVTGAKGLGSIVAESGKQVQAFAFYGSAKRGASMTAYNRIDDEVILNHEKFTFESGIEVNQNLQIYPHWFKRHIYTIL